VSRNQKKTVLFRIAALLCCGLATDRAATAQQLQALPVADALNVRSFVGLEKMNFSPDGKWLAYMAKEEGNATSADYESGVRTGVPPGLTGTDIYISNVETGQTKNLTNGKGSNWLPSWSPDGQRVAFLSDRDGSGQAKLWICDLLNNNAKKVSDVNVRTDQIEWAPNGQQLLVTVVPDGLSVEDYAKRVLSGEPSLKTVVDRAPGSTVMLYQSSGNVGKESPTSPPWSLDAFLRDLALVDVANGKTWVIVHGRRIAYFSLAPDGTSVAYTIPKRFEKAGSQQTLFDLAFDLAIVAPEGKHGRVIASDIRFDYDGSEFSWSPNSKYLSYHTGGVNEKAHDCYIVDVGGGSTRNITHFPLDLQVPHYVSSVPLWDGDKHLYLIKEAALWRASVEEDKAVKFAEIPGREILAPISRNGDLLLTADQGRSTIVVTHDGAGKQDGFYRIDLTNGKSSELFERSQCYFSCSGTAAVATSDGLHIGYYAEDAQNAGDIWTSDVRFSNPGKLTHLNPQLEKYKMGPAKLIDWLSDDGERLQGALLLPADYEEEKRYPLIVYVYGGDFESNSLDKSGFSHGPLNMQLLATRGYAVLFPDSPQKVGTPMFDLAKTVLPGVNKVIEMGIADPARLGVMGHSNGGYSTLALIVQTKRFEAAIEADGMGDLISHYGEMDKSGTAYGSGLLENGQDALGGSPWDVRDKYIENSPIFYLDRVETPLLIVQGANDDAVAPFSADEVFVGLRRLGREVEYARYEGENHSPLYWSYPNQVDFANRMIAWFARYLAPPKSAGSSPPSALVSVR
jgi:dipeptidyl aminopeptidase/acylaminoacyl peptidase